MQYFDISVVQLFDFHQTYSGEIPPPLGFLRFKRVDMHSFTSIL